MSTETTYRYPVTGQMLSDLESGEVSLEEFRDWHKGMPQTDVLYAPMGEALGIWESRNQTEAS